MPRLDDNGQPMRLKVPNKQTGKTVKEQRAQVETFSEFYIADKDDIDLFINMFAVNAEQFDWKQYVVDVDETKTSLDAVDNNGLGTVVVSFDLVTPNILTLSPTKNLEVDIPLILNLLSTIDPVP